MAITERTWKVGELARETGVTVRALHHFEDKGLLAPGARTESGYRLYSPDDVRRLYRVLALRHLGIPLQDIARMLEGKGDLAQLLQLQLEEVDRQLELNRTLRWKLTVLISSLREGGIPTEQFIDTMEAITRMNTYFTPEQQADLARRAAELGPDGLRQAERDWADLIAAVRAEMEKGTDPGDPVMQPLARRWHALIAAFTGGDLAIARGVAQRYKAEGWEKPSHGMLDSSVMEYMGRVFESSPNA
jgi:MerR family transcriptional regulator, thiopeptide resistance regulator